MSKQRGTVPGPAKQRVSWKDFYDTYAGPLNELLRSRDGSAVERVTLRDLAQSRVGAKLTLPRPSPFMMAADRLNELGIGRMLAAAAVDNSPDAFKKILEVLLLLMDLRVPKGVFAPPSKTGRPGRPIARESERIYSRWVEIGEPSPFRNDLAKAFYGAAFNKASGTDRRKMRDRCRQAVERYLDRLIADLQTESAKQNKEIARLEEELAAERRAARQ
jgi:hypothetical protein